MADGGFKLNLSSLREPLDDEDAGGGAEVQLDVAGIMASPRAQTEAVLATPPTAQRPADASGKNVEVSLVWQNNGLEDFSAGHTICVPAVGGGMKAQASAGWTLPPAKDKLCHSLQALPKRTSHALPPLTVTVDGASTSHLEFVFAVELQASPKFAWTMVLRVRNEALTYKECDELCICPSDEALAMEYSHECRARVPEGSNCRTAKEAHTGSNWASSAPPPPPPAAAAAASALPGRLPCAQA